MLPKNNGLVVVPTNYSTHGLTLVKSNWIIHTKSMKTCRGGW